MALQKSQKKVKGATKNSHCHMAAQEVPLELKKPTSSIGLFQVYKN